jgi:hypothetical protein
LPPEAGSSGIESDAPFASLPQSNVPHLARLVSASVALLLLSLSATAAPAPNGVAPSRPNILFIIFDDWGWQHAGAYRVHVGEDA